MKRVTQQQARRLGNIAKKHYRGDGSWSETTEKQLLKEADILLGVGRGKKRDGLRSSRPKEEALFSSDYLDKVQLKRAVA